MEVSAFKALLNRYRAGETTTEENARLESWYMDLGGDDFQRLDEEELKAAQQMIWSKFNAEHQVMAGTGRRLWPGITALPVVWKVAAAVATITLGIWLYYASSIKGRHPELSTEPALAQDISPGKNTATLTLADGKVITLDSNKTSVVVSDSVKTITTLIASTPRGGTYQITLPDGTRVWLNSDSKISFPSQFSGKERRIVLKGEAYFAVVHNAKQPFRVESKGQMVEDIGTEFNIQAYDDEPMVKTTLVEGEAAVNGKILKPNQQATLSAGEIKVEEVNTAEAIAWKEGYFRFNNTKITDIMQQLSRWYNIEVVYEGKATEEGLYGKISRYKNISDVLSMLEKTGLVRFKVEGRRVAVSR